MLVLHNLILNSFLILELLKQFSKEETFWAVSWKPHQLLTWLLQYYMFYRLRAITLQVHHHRIHSRKIKSSSLTRVEITILLPWQTNHALPQSFLRAGLLTLRWFGRLTQNWSLQLMASLALGRRFQQRHQQVWFSLIIRDNFSVKICMHFKQEGKG